MSKWVERISWDYTLIRTTKSGTYSSDITVQFSVDGFLMEHYFVAKMGGGGGFGFWGVVRNKRDIYIYIYIYLF